MAFSRQYHPWSSAPDNCFAPDQLSVWLRVDQATTNFLETFPFFAALVLVAHVTHHHSLLTLWGAHLYFWARLGYVLAAAAGYGLLRSVLFWNTALAGMVLFLVALLA